MVDQSIVSFLSKLQINPEGAAIYLVLVNQPAQSAQVIAQKTGIPKTTVYRRVEELRASGLVEERIHESTRAYAAASPDFLSFLVLKKEQEAVELRAQLPMMTHLLHEQAVESDPETKVLYYRGRDGIRQMVWNVLHAKTEVTGYTFRNLAPFVGRKFYTAWRDEFHRRGLKGRDVLSEEYVKNTPGEADGAGWGSRYVPADVLDIQHQMDIYNDVVGIYNWVGHDVFGVEIYNQKVANMQRQMFELLWEKGLLVDDLNRVDRPTGEF